MTSASPPDLETPRWYAEKVRTYGFDHRGLGFRTRSSQEKRFEALCGLGDFHGARLLDVGCGFGDFLAFLQARGVQPLYTGIDICEPMVRRCRERFRSGGRFLVAEALSHSPDEPYDYVVASGIFGYNARDTRERVRPTLEHLFSLARIGMAVNFLSCRAPARSPGRLYLHPSDVLQFAFELTPAVKLDHSYLPNDFTLCLYRTPPWQQES